MSKYYELIQIMTDPENQPPQITFEEALLEYGEHIKSHFIEKLDWDMAFGNIPRPSYQMIKQELLDINLEEL